MNHHLIDTSTIMIDLRAIYKNKYSFINMSFNTINN